MYRMKILAVDPITIQSVIYMASQLYEYFWKYKNKVSDSNFYGGIFLPYLADNYVDLSDLYVVLSDLYVDLSDLYVDLSLIHFLTSVLARLMRYR